MRRLHRGDRAQVLLRHLALLRALVPNLRFELSASPLRRKLLCGAAEDARSIQSNHATLVALHVAARLLRRRDRLA